ncbi:MAG: HEPN domain-containing protein [Candidatus Korarchaeota archaeon]
MKDEIRVFLRRADGFIRNAYDNLKSGDNDLAMFHVEQACQLILKAKFLDLVGHFEKTHSLVKLARGLGEIISNEEINKFIEENNRVLRNLERAYVLSRYYPVDFDREEVEEALKVYEKLRDLLWKA